MLTLSLVLACGGTLDAGADKPQGLLPVDGRNPTILFGDGYIDNWQGEYALLFAGTGKLNLVGIVVNTSPAWKSIDELMTGWQAMVDAARKGGLKNVPEVTASTGSVLVKPSDGRIDSTQPTESQGARLILDASSQLAKPYRPLVVVTGVRLTDVASAYLMDPSVADRIVVVSALGSVTKGGGVMGIANGEMDTWADVIVAQKLRYVQVSTYYDQMADVPASLLDGLPDNEFTSWIRAKQPKVWNDLDAADQNAVIAVANPGFVTEVIPVILQGTETNNQPLLVKDSNGPILLVTQVSGALATADLWQMLLSRATFAAP